MRARLALALVTVATTALPAMGEVLTALRTIRPGEVIGPADLGTTATGAPGALDLPEQAVGMAARRMLVPGRPIMPADVGAPLIVRRNGPVALVYQAGALTIRAEGRALSDGAAGDAVRVMNVASRQTIMGRVMPDGTIEVGGSR